MVFNNAVVVFPGSLTWHRVCVLGGAEPWSSRSKSDLRSESVLSRSVQIYPDDSGGYDYPPRKGNDQELRVDTIPNLLLPPSLLRLHQTHTPKHPTSRLSIGGRDVDTGPHRLLSHYLDLRDTSTPKTVRERRGVCLPSGVDPRHTDAPICVLSMWTEGGATGSGRVVS